MAQSLVAHMPATFVDLLRSDVKLGGGQPVQLGGTEKDRVTDEAIAANRTWLLGIVSVCPTTVASHYLIADAFLVANEYMNGRVLIVPPAWTAMTQRAMAVQAGVNCKKMIQYIRSLWRRSAHASRGPSSIWVDEIKGLMRCAVRESMKRKTRQSAAYTAETPMIDSNILCVLDPPSPHKLLPVCLPDCLPVCLPDCPPREARTTPIKRRATFGLSPEAEAVIKRRAAVEEREYAGSRTSWP
jgi:hypothetical protein